MKSEKKILTADETEEVGQIVITFYKDNSTGSLFGHTIVPHGTMPRGAVLRAAENLLSITIDQIQNANNELEKTLQLGESQTPQENA